MAMNMDVAFKISAGVTGQQAVDRLKDSLTGLERVSVGLDRSFMAVGRTLAGAFIGVQAVSALSGFSRQVVNSVDGLKDMSERTGIAVAELSKLEYAAKMNGTSLEAVQTGLKQIADKAKEAATGNKDLAALFETLGVKLKDGGGLRDGLALFEDTAAAIGSIENPTLKAALAVEVFGRSGLELVPLLTNLEASRKEAEAMGFVVGEEFAVKAAAFNDSMDRLGYASRGFVITVGDMVLPTLTNLLNEFTRGIAIAGGFWEALRLFGTANPLNTVAENAKKSREEIERLNKEIAFLESRRGASNNQNPRASGMLDAKIGNLRGSLADEQKRLSFFEFQMGGSKPPEAPTGGAGTDSVARVQEILRQLEEARGNTAGKSADKVQQLLRGLDDEIARMDQLTRYETELRNIQEGRYGKVTEAQKQLILGKAREVDQAREMSEIEKELAQIQQDNARKRLEMQEQIKSEGKRVFEETRTPMERLNAEFERLNKLLEAGAIDFDTYERAGGQAMDKFNDSQKTVKDGFAELESAVRGFGSTFTETLMTAFQTGKLEFKSLVSSILLDLARLTISKGITEPIFGAISKSIGGGAGGGATGGSLFDTAKRFFGFANGGIMSASGALPLNYYSNGGVARSPQLAVFGEGRMNEAFVPLPDGRSIPVRMEGGGGNVTVNVSVESGKTTTEGQAGQLGKAIAATVRDELLKQKRPGGLLAA